MASNPIMVAPQIRLEDPLAHLPCSGSAEYGKGQVIYDRHRPPAGMYLIIDGSVRVCRIALDGRQVVADIYGSDDFFGESALLGEPYLAEQAIAFEDTRVMAWTAAEIEEIACRRPRLAVALWQTLAQRTLDLGHRIESFSVDNVARRLAHSLIRFSERRMLEETAAVQQSLSLLQLQDTGRMEVAERRDYIPVRHLRWAIRSCRRLSASHHGCNLAAILLRLVTEVHSCIPADFEGATETTENTET